MRAKFRAMMCIDGCAAHSHLAVRVLGVEPAGSHATMLAAGGFRPYGTRFHGESPVKGGLDTVFLRFFQHSGRGFTRGQIPGVLVLFLFPGFFHRLVPFHTFSIGPLLPHPFYSFVRSRFQMIMITLAPAEKLASSHPCLPFWFNRVSRARTWLSEISCLSHAPSREQRYTTFPSSVTSWIETSYSYCFHGSLPIPGPAGKIYTDRGRE